MEYPKFFRNGTLLLIFLVLLASAAAGSQKYGDGSDGSLTVTSNTVVNDYTYLTGDEASGSSSIAVNDASKFSSGDELMIIQMQNGTGNGVAGSYEFRRVSSASSGTLSFEETLNNQYFSGQFDQKTAEITQAIRVPEYTEVVVKEGGSISARKYNGYTGGIIAFRSTDRVVVNGTINASASKVNSQSTGQSSMGFRGAETTSTHDSVGRQGESYSGYGGYDSENPNRGGGTGGGFGTDQSCDNCEGGAGGGSYGDLGTAGEKSNLGTVSSPGEKYGGEKLERIFLGSGGGAGANDGTNEEGYGGAGGAGGGAVFISSKSVTTRGSVSANGADGQDAWQAGGNQAEPGGGGAGSGGTIYIRSDDIEILGTVHTLGGNSGQGLHPSYEDDGGKGGNGRIRLDYNSISGLSNVDPDPGYTGEAPDFCDERGPGNECYIKSEREISSQSIEIVEPFSAFTDSKLFSSTFSPLTVRNSANISGIFRGSINFSAENIRIKSGAHLRPENGIISIKER